VPWDGGALSIFAPIFADETKWRRIATTGKRAPNFIVLFFCRMQTIQNGFLKDTPGVYLEKL
jgi:hypothetical protein